MLVNVDPTDDRPMYVQIMDEIRAAIVVGVVEHDDALPSVRQLAADIRVNPNTIKRAYRELERDGVIYVQRGKGTYVAAPTKMNDMRSELAQELASRSLREAYRLGLTVDAFTQALELAARNDITPAMVEETVP
jgi:GntR family transcriptional regulator